MDAERKGNLSKLEGKLQAQWSAMAHAKYGRMRQHFFCFAFLFGECGRPQELGVTDLNEACCHGYQETLTQS